MTAIFLFSVPAYGKPNEINNLEKKQVECITIAYQEGNKINLYGDTWGETVASIAYQESWCNGSTWQTNGVVVGDRNNKGKPRSLGVMQVQVRTAREVGKKFPEIFREKYGDRDPSDEELTIDLLVDITFNIRVGVHYFAYLLEYRNGDVDKAILSYNRGTGKKLKDINDYVRRVKKWRKTVVIPLVKKK